MPHETGMKHSRRVTASGRRSTKRPDPKQAQAQLNALRTMLEMQIVSFMKGLASQEFRAHLRSNRYLDRGTPERAYWHAGYTAAMSKLLQFVNDGVTEYPVANADPNTPE